MRTFVQFFTFQILIYFLVPFPGNTQSIDIDDARSVAEFKITQLNKSKEYQIHEGINIFKDDKGKILYYIFELSPNGYIVVTANKKLPPVIAYSFLNNYESIEGKHFLENFLKADLQNRLSYAHLISPLVISKREALWNLILLEKSTINDKYLFEQWPPEGTTITGGWLETNWTQNAPYNNFCPMDPVTNQRSIAGCPAVALAQIINYYKTINGAEFGDEDDYYHTYAGRNYWIDDDFAAIDFPSFPTLNAYLDTVTNCFETQTALKQNEKASLNFACGVAAQQVYTSSISGTFGVDQAYEAYQRFGFTEAVLMDDSDTSLYTKLKQHMMEARPVHLAVVDPAGTMGHNLVIDGYNSDDYYHLNLGWGGSYNGWYLLPEEIPYGLTVVEGVIVNIAFPPVYTSVNWQLTDPEFFEFKISPNPASTCINISFNLTTISTVEIFIIDTQGKCIMQDLKKDLQLGSNRIRYNLVDKKGIKFIPGVYLCRLFSNNKSTYSKFIIK